MTHRGCDVDLLGAYLLAATDPAEDAEIERHVGRCPACTAEVEVAGRELEAAFASASAVDAANADAANAANAVEADTVEADTVGTELPVARDDGLARLLEVARRRRPAARTTVAPAAGFADRVAVTGRVLAEFTDADWERPTVESWTARELVAHLAAVDATVAAALGVPLDPAPGSDDSATSWTAATQAAQRDWTATRVRDAWQRMADQLCDAATRAVTGRPAAATVVVGGHRATVADHLTDRAFETWIHSRDLARLVGVAVPDPSPAQLRGMADLALRHLQPLWLSAVRDDYRTPPGSLDVRLAGTGGGRWLVTPSGVTTSHETNDYDTNGHDRPSPQRSAPHQPTGRQPTTVLDVSATQFCLLVADRLDPDAVEADAEVHGEVSSARALLTAAPTLARP